MLSEIVYNENIGLVFQGKSVHMLDSILWSFKFYHITECFRSKKPALLAKGRLFE